MKRNYKAKAVKPGIIFIVGPTAVGKTDIAVSLAKKINAEIISCDSMQIYKGMDIIASFPLPALRKKILHHLIACVWPSREYNVACYRREAIKKINRIIKKGKTPLLVGGTGHYMSILVDGIFKTAAEDKKIRDKLYARAASLGSRYLHQRLQQADPQAALKIHPNDTKRIVRALEVFELTGKPISELQKQRRGLADKYEIKMFCLDMPRQKLYDRIDRRVERMFAAGLMHEVKNLFKLKLGRTASCAIGIKEIKGYLEGLYDLEEAKRLMKKNTRNYAKRQLTWFRKDKRVEWIDIRNKESAASVALRIAGAVPL